MAPSEKPSDLLQANISHLRPYLGLNARLSQVWINRWTIILVLLFVNVLSTAVLLKNDVQSAKREALSACLAVEQAASTFASLPHFMAQGLNTMTKKGIDASVSALSDSYYLP
jgi:hypothetical protein